LNNISRNVPDNVLDKIGRGHGKVDGVVMVKSVIILTLEIELIIASIPLLLLLKGRKLELQRLLIILNILQTGSVDISTIHLPQMNSADE
jgi:hypothetical protein